MQTKRCQCGKDFFIYSYRLKESKFCSMICQRKYRIYGQNKGKKCPKGSLAKLGKKNPRFGFAKGTSSVAIHDWVKKRLKKSETCEHCKENKRVELANTNEHLYQRDLEDWKWLCRKCHLIFDNRLVPSRLGKHNSKESMIKHWITRRNNLKKYEKV